MSLPLPFTNVSTGLFLYALLWNGTYWGTACLVQIFVLTSFTCALACDPTCYARIRAKRGWSEWLFYFGNMALHVWPCAYACFLHPPAALSARDLAEAQLLFWGWWLSVYALHRTSLDEIYVPLPQGSWTVCIAAGAVAQAACLMHP